LVSSVTVVVLRLDRKLSELSLGRQTDLFRTARRDRLLERVRLVQLPDLEHKSRWRRRRRRAGARAMWLA
jgi:hypothetical protein